MDFPALASLNDGFKHARILQTACELELFDHTTEPVGHRKLASALDISEKGARILADALVALSLLDKDEDGLYSNPEHADRFLVATSETYFGGMCRFDAMNWTTWGELEAAVRTGEPQREPMHQQDPAETRRFMEAMVSIGKARGDAEVLPARVDLADRRMLVDVGGGPGHFTRALLAAYPTLEACIVDLPGTLAVTERLLDGWGPERERVVLVEGDYIDDPLPACDAVLLSNILHGEPPERCQGLLDNIASAMVTGGQLVVKEHVLEPGRTAPETAALFAVDMLLMTGGDCYTLDQVEGWLEAAGFEDVHEQPPEPPLTSSLVLATKG